MGSDLLGRFLSATVSLVLLAGTVVQSYPAGRCLSSFRIRWGGSDLVARGIGQMRAQKLGPSFVVENRVSARF